MSAFKGHAKSLSDLYVYYKRLKSDGFYPNLAKYVSSTSWRILFQTQKYSLDASAIRAQAQAEFSKEKALLKEKFGVDINFDYYRDQSDFKEVIEALNVCLNLKEVYERNVQVIKNTNMKGVFTWYPTYFMHAWQEAWPTISKRFYQEFESGMEASIILSNILDDMLPDICVLGIQKMLDGPEVEHSSVDPVLKNAYSILVNQIGSVSSVGSVAQQIYKTYQLDDLKKNLLKDMKVKNGKIYANDFRPKAKKMVSKQIHQRGGFSLEAIETAIFQQIASTLQGATAIHSGSREIKADNILTLSIDSNIVYKYLEEANGTREGNIKALTELGEKLSNLNEGFIVYSSDKNWSLNAGFKGFDGGSVGENVQSFINNVYKNSSSMNTLIGAIQQLGEGAMLSGQKDVFERLLAQDVAYMLFDDFSTIGVATPGGKAIHVMNLNGILMPMSVFLSMIADAIESVDKEELQRLARVTIQAPPILWETQEEQEKAYPNQGRTAWEVQKQWALDNTKISLRFLKDFKSFVTSLL